LNFATATRIIFGNGKISQVTALLRDAGRKVLLVTGKNQQRAAIFSDKLTTEGFEIILFRVEKEPTTHIVSEGVELARENGCQAVIGFGGGSAIDSAKAIAAMSPNKGELTDFLEVIGKGKQLTQKPLPFIAVPTTAGTGADGGQKMR